MRILLHLCLGALPMLPLKAQDALPLSADRPGVSTSPGVTPAGTFQFENGFEYYQNRSMHAYRLPALLFRTGVTRVAEVRMGIGITRQDSLRGGERTASQWNTSALSAGTKVNLCKQQRWLPEMALVVNLVLPYTTQANLKSAYMGHNFLLVTNHEIGSKLSLCTNLGGSWEGNSAGGTFTYTTCLGRKITGRTGFFLEHYGYWAEKARLSPGVDAGVFHLVTPCLQVDLSAGTTWTDGIGDYFIATGLSFKINRHHRATAAKAATEQPVVD